MFFSINHNYLVQKLPELLLAFRKGGFESSHWYEEVYQWDFQERNASLQYGRKFFPVIVDLKTPIVKYTSYGYIGTQYISSLLKSLDSHPSVTAIVLDIDSGGGMVSGTQELAHTIRSMQKPTIAYTGGYMCSAAYWIGSACDKVVAAPFAECIGSIGTMLSAQDFAPLLEKYGAKVYELYAPESTEKNKAWRALKAGDDKDVLQNLSDFNARFLNDVRAFRTEVNEIVFKGDVYMPEKANELGLIDEIMTLDEIIRQLIN